MRSRSTIVAAVAAAGLLVGTAVTAGPGWAGTRPPHTRIAVHFDLAAGQMPENIALSPRGTAYLTFAAARQVASVTPDGVTRILATMPVPGDGGAATPVLGFALTTGIVRDSAGTLYFLYASGAASTGLYRLRPGGTPALVAALPPAGLPNGLALDERTGTLYLTDSVLGTVTAVPASGGAARVWSAAPDLAAAGFLGANGIKVHDGAVWVTNLDRGTLLRIPVGRGGRSGPAEVRARDLTGVDDFAFTGRGDEVLAARNGPNTVVRIAADGTATTVLTAADGLQNPTATAIRGTEVYVLSAAYTTARDPNLIRTVLPRR